MVRSDSGVPSSFLYFILSSRGVSIGVVFLKSSLSDQILNIFVLVGEQPSLSFVNLKAEEVFCNWSWALGGFALELYFAIELEWPDLEYICAGWWTAFLEFCEPQGQSMWVGPNPSCERKHEVIVGVVIFSRDHYQILWSHPHKQATDNIVITDHNTWTFLNGIMMDHIDFV